MDVYREMGKRFDIDILKALCVALKKYGTSEGAQAAWDTRGRGRKTPDGGSDLSGKEQATIERETRAFLTGKDRETIQRYVSRTEEHIKNTKPGDLKTPEGLRTYHTLSIQFNTARKLLPISDSNRHESDDDIKRDIKRDTETGLPKGHARPTR